MNQNIDKLQTYPFEKLRQLLSAVETTGPSQAISLAFGEPKHTTPKFIKEACVGGVDALAVYPPTFGAAALRNNIAAWLSRRYKLQGISSDLHILPVNGTREALFSFAQSVIDVTHPHPTVIMSNPFYQIYEGAALLAGAVPQYINLSQEYGFANHWDTLPQKIWERTQLIYVCSPHNPTGNVLTLAQWEALFILSDRYDFVIAADECYSEIYFDENAPVLGALQAAEMLGRADYRRLVTFNSLSKRSSVPGLRSGFVAGDAEILKKFLLYRTYHGSAMSGVISNASIAAWEDEAHVVENRSQYREKLQAVLPILNAVTHMEPPDASFFLWMPTPFEDVQFTRQLYRDQNVSVLPGNYLARKVRGVNPGQNFIRIALVASLDECVEGAERISRFIQSI